MARKGENIYHRKDGRWEGRFVKGRVGMRTIFGYVFGKSYRETKGKLAVARQKWNVYADEAKKRQGTLRVISTQWMKEFTPLLKASTLAKYGDYLRCYLLPTFGDHDMNDIKNQHISDLCSNLLAKGGTTGQGLSPKTVSEILRVMKHLRTYACQREYAVGFSNDIMTIRQAPKPIRIFSISEQEKLRTYLKAHLTLSNLGILLCLSTGIRLGELCALKWEDISFEEKKIYINKTMQRVRVEGGTKTKILVTAPKSKSSVRTIPLPDEIFDRDRMEHHGGAFLLTGSAMHFVEPRTMQNRFKALLIACHIDAANFHALRHTFATRCVEVGFDVKCLSEILGHASVNITLNCYVHPTMELKRANMSKVSTA